MKNPISSIQALLALVVIIGDFGIVVTFIAVNRPPDEYIVALVSGSFSLVLGFFFGHANGTTSALAVAATALADRTAVDAPPLTTLSKSTP